MQQIRALGHLPGWTEEAPLALRLKRAKDAEELTASQLAELEAIRAHSRPLSGLCVILMSLWAVVSAFDHCGACVGRSWSFLGASLRFLGPLSLTLGIMCNTPGDFCQQQSLCLRTCSNIASPQLQSVHPSSPPPEAVDAPQQKIHSAHEAVHTR